MTKRCNVWFSEIFTVSSDPLYLTGSVCLVSLRFESEKRWVPLLIDGGDGLSEGGPYKVIGSQKGQSGRSVGVPNEKFGMIVS